MPAPQRLAALVLRSVSFSTLTSPRYHQLYEFTKTSSTLPTLPTSSIIHQRIGVVAVTHPTHTPVSKKEKRKSLAWRKDGL
jgi:hypothetical protein